MARLRTRHVRRFAVGDAVRVEGWGLDRSRLTVSALVAAPYYDLAFEHNGNTIPGHYHEDLIGSDVAVDVAVRVNE